MAALNVEAILFNYCQPDVIEQALDVAQSILQEKEAAYIELGAYANAFPPMWSHSGALYRGWLEAELDSEPVLRKLFLT